MHIQGVILIHYVKTSEMKRFNIQYFAFQDRLSTEWAIFKCFEKL